VPVGRTVRSDNRPYKFVQTIDYGTLVTTSAGGQVFFAKGFSANDLPQISSFQALFDQYRISAVEVYLTTSSSTGISNPVSWFAAVDYDDATTPSNTNALLQYTNVVEAPLSNAVYFHFTPHAVGNLATGSGAMNLPAPWINSATPSVVHYGVKGASYATATTYQISCRVRMHVDFRNVF